MRLFSARAGRSFGGSMIRTVERVGASGPLFIAALFTSACSLVNPPATEPDLAHVVAVVRIAPDRPWTDTGVTVRSGERIFITAAGTVRWAATGATSSPDGL